MLCRVVGDPASLGQNCVAKTLDRKSAFVARVHVGHNRHRGQEHHQEVKWKFLGMSRHRALLRYPSNLPTIPARSPNTCDNHGQGPREVRRNAMAA